MHREGSTPDPSNLPKPSLARASDKLSQQDFVTNLEGADSLLRRSPRTGGVALRSVERGRGI